MANAKIFPPMSEREIRGAAISRHAASEGMVLLKNRSAALPLAPGQAIALFGSGAARTVRGGTGSGDPFNGGLSGGGAGSTRSSPLFPAAAATASRHGGGKGLVYIVLDRACALG